MTLDERIAQLEKQNSDLQFQLCILVDQCIHMRALIEEQLIGKYDRNTEDGNELREIKRAIGSIRTPQ